MILPNASKGWSVANMYLLHNPYVFLITADIQTGWKGLETVHAEGKARDIGVSNFHRSHLEAVLEVCVLSSSSD